MEIQRLRDNLLLIQKDGQNYTYTTNANTTQKQIDNWANSVKNGSINERK